MSSRPSQSNARPLLTDPAERRRHERLDINLGVTYRSSSLTVDTLADNISLGGVFLVSGQRDPVGTNAEVILEVPNGKALSLQGRVAWCTPKGMGVAFGELPRQPRAMLANLLLETSR